MTLLKFLTSKLYEDSEHGDLARDVYSDPEFPADKSTEEIISYLDIQTRAGGTNRTLNSLLKQYKKLTEAHHDDLYEIEKYVVL